MKHQEPCTVGRKQTNEQATNVLLKAAILLFLSYWYILEVWFS